MGSSLLTGRISRRDHAGTRKTSRLSNAPTRSLHGGAGGPLEQATNSLRRPFRREHLKHPARLEGEDQVDGVASGRTRRHIAGYPHDELLEQLPPARVARKQRLGEFWIGRRRVVEPADGRIAIPEIAENLDQLIKAVPRIGHRHGVFYPGEAPPPPDVVKNGF